MTDNTRRWNWPLWTGFALVILGFLSYFLIFARFPITRDVPWANLILLAVALMLLFIGVKRALHRGTLRAATAILLAVLGLGITGAFVFATFVFSKRLPTSSHAPAIAAKAPDFALTDVQSGAKMTLAQLLSESPKGVVLVFYRGYW